MSLVVVRRFRMFRTVKPERDAPRIFGGAMQLWSGKRDEANEGHEINGIQFISEVTLTTVVGW